MKLILNTVILAVFLTILLSSAHAAKIPDPDKWFKKEYAKLWSKTPWKKRDEILSHYVENFTEHPADGFQRTYSRQDFIGDEMLTWKSQGWLSSNIAAFQSEQINDTTVMFRVMWRDDYKSGEMEISCGWYMADFNGEKWLFTQYADFECPARKK
ncbi:MAG: hypothetical protein AAF431_09880 [Pseudomonadota bacterium]